MKYDNFTIEDWEALGKEIEAAEARYSGPAGDAVGEELRDYSARQLNIWVEEIDSQVTDIRIKAETRERRLRTARRQIKRALEGA